MDLTIECVANRLPFCNAYYDFEVMYKIPNGCLVEMHASAPIGNQGIVWGEEIVLPPFDEYTYTSDNCDGYTITYEAMIRTVNNELRPLPAEIQFFPNNRTFIGRKCVPGYPETASDPDCLGMPTTQKYKVVIKATLVTAIQVFTNTQNTFDFTITPDCRADTLMLSSDWDLFQYYITSTDPETLIQIPIIS